MNEIDITFKYRKDCSFTTHSQVENVYEELNHLPVFTNYDQIPEELLDFIAQVSSVYLQGYCKTSSSIFIKFKGRKSNFINPVENQTIYKTYLRFLKRPSTIFFKLYHQLQSVIMITQI
jgi:hypothetical protein